VTNPQNAVGALTATDTNGTVGWTYTVANSAVQYLAAGETLVQTFNVAVAENHGGTASDAVTVTITGTNEAPVLSASAQSAKLAETTNPADTLSSTGAFTYSDVDASDAHTVSVTAPQNAVGALTATDTNGTVGWTYTVANANVQHLVAGETLVQTYSVAVADRKSTRLNSSH